MGLYENIRSEPVSRLALREPVVVSPEATVRDAVTQMRRGKLGCAIVVDDERRPIGLFPESNGDARSPANRTARNLLGCC